MEFTKNEFKLFREEMKKAVAELEEKFGVEINFGKITYDANSFKINTEVSNGSKEDAKKSEFKRYCARYNLKPEDYGKTLENKGKTYILIGLEMNRRKFPLLFECEDGKRTLFTTDVISKLR
jgi:hypothetical protein